MGLLNLLQHPLTKGMDLDDPETTNLRKKIIQEKPLLKKIYEEWYRAVCDYIPEIDAGRPVMISAPPYGFPGYSQGHSVVGVGYQYTTDGIVTWDEYYIVNDPNCEYYLWWALGAVNLEMYTKVIPPS